MEGYLNRIKIQRMASTHFSICNSEQLKISLKKSGTRTHSHTRTHAHTHSTHAHTHTDAHMHITFLVILGAQDLLMLMGSKY